MRALDFDGACGIVPCANVRKTRNLTLPRRAAGRSSKTSFTDVCTGCGGHFEDPIVPKNDGKTPQQRFSERYVVDQQTGCWNWTAGINGRGYAYLWVPNTSGVKTKWRGKSLQAYKLAFIWKFGPVPDGMELDHVCRNRRCVNPDHVIPATHLQNQLNSDKTFTAINASKTHCKHGHQFTEDNIYRMPNGARACRTCRLNWHKTRKEG